jgi:hypothetical protein
MFAARRPCWSWHVVTRVRFDATSPQPAGHACEGVQSVLCQRKRHTSATHLCVAAGVGDGQREKLGVERPSWLRHTTERFLMTVDASHSSGGHTCGCHRLMVQFHRQRGAAAQVAVTLGRGGQSKVSHVGSTVLTASPSVRWQLVVRVSVDAGVSQVTFGHTGVGVQGVDTHWYVGHNTAGQICVALG